MPDINILVNYGAIGLCLAYFIWKDNNTTKELKDTVQTLKEVVLQLKERISVDNREV